MSEADEEPTPEPIIPKEFPTDPPATWSNSDVLRWLISIDETDFLDLFVKRKVTGRTLLLMHLDEDNTEDQHHLGTFVKKYADLSGGSSQKEFPDVHSDPVYDPMRQHSLAGHIKALKSGRTADDNWKGWITDVEFRVWREHFRLEVDRGLALAHKAVWRRRMRRYNWAATLLSALAALIGSLSLAIFQNKQVGNAYVSCVGGS